MKTALRKQGSTWHFDEMFDTPCGERYLLWRAVDEHSTELDILLQKQRDKTAAKRLFERMLRSNPVPRKTLSHQPLSYPAAICRDSEIGAREACVRQSDCPIEQPN